MSENVCDGDGPGRTPDIVHCSALPACLLYTFLQGNVGFVSS